MDTQIERLATRNDPSSGPEMFLERLATAIQKLQIVVRYTQRSWRGQRAVAADHAKEIGNFRRQWGRSPHIIASANGDSAVSLDSRVVGRAGHRRSTAERDLVGCGLPEIALRNLQRRACGRAAQCDCRRDEARNGQGSGRGPLKASDRSLASFPNRTRPVDNFE